MGKEGGQGTTSQKRKSKEKPHKKAGERKSI
jgi:hypothetical protein